MLNRGRSKNASTSASAAVRMINPTPRHETSSMASPGAPASCVHGVDLIIIESVRETHVDTGIVSPRLSR